MNMNEYTTQYLAELGIDTRSRIYAIQDAGALEFDENTYRRIIGELTGTEDVNIGDDYARHTFMYLIDGIMQDNPDLSAAEARAIAYVDANRWVLAKPEYEYEPKQTVDALGQPKQRKGAKKEAAIVFWKSNQGKFTTRKEWIAALADNVGLTEAAASTYHHNLKTGKWS